MVRDDGSRPRTLSRENTCCPAIDQWAMESPKSVIPRPHLSHWLGFVRPLLREQVMDIANMLSRQGRRLLQIGVALLLALSLEGFAIPNLASAQLGLSAHRLA